MIEPWAPSQGRPEPGWKLLEAHWEPGDRFVGTGAEKTQETAGFRQLLGDIPTLGSRRLLPCFVFIKASNQSQIL